MSDTSYMNVQIWKSLSNDTRINDLKNKFHTHKVIGVYWYPQSSPIPQQPGFHGNRCNVHILGGVLSLTEEYL